MARKTLSVRDFQLNQLLNTVAHIIAGNPGAPVEGQWWYNSATKRWMYRTDAANIDPRDRANHSGTQLAATVSDFDTQVRTSRLDQMAAPTADVALNGRKITGLADGVAATDGATVSQVNAAAAGLAPKDAVRAATTAAGALATDFDNLSVVDGVALATGDRILIKNQATASENGIYTVNAAGAPTRTTDADSSDDLRGALIPVEEGTTNANTLWMLTTDAPIVVDTTGLNFSQIGTMTITAGGGLTLTGTTIDVGAGTGIVVGVDTISIDTAVVVRKYAANVGDGAATQIDRTHNLGTRDITVAVSTNATPWEEVDVEVQKPDANTVRLIFAVAPATDAYRVVVHG